MTTLFPQKLQVLAYSSTITARHQIFLYFKFSPTNPDQRAFFDARAVQISNLFEFLALKYMVCPNIGK